MIPPASDPRPDPAHGARFDPPSPAPGRPPYALVAGLGTLALVRPLVRIVEDQTGAGGSAAVPIALTVVISAVWIAVIGLLPVPRPVLTLVLVGLIYGVLSIALSAVLSPMLEGHLDGPLAHPQGIIPALTVNIVWGLLAGLAAAGVRHVVRDRRGAGR